MSKLVLTFREPTAGFWDGGMKLGGTFNPTIERDAIQWGCWELNLWFRMPLIEDMNLAAKKAKRKLQSICRRPCIIEINHEN